ncbi:ECF-type sigma factor [soil metagenome]
MVQEGSITGWVQRLAAGDADAAGPIWDRFYQRMVALASGRLPRAKEDAEDVALSAFFQFCRAANEQRFARLANREDLWHLLVVLTARKAIDWRKRQSALKRGVPTGELHEALPGPDLDPALDAVLKEEVRTLFERLDDEDLRTIAQLKLEGHTVEEIAQRLTCTTRTVFRRLSLIRDLWELDPATMAGN